MAWPNRLQRLMKGMGSGEKEQPVSPMQPIPKTPTMNTKPESMSSLLPAMPTPNPEDTHPSEKGSPRFKKLFTKRY